jgi:Tfp pilus assembly protein PilF
MVGAAGMAVALAVVGSGLRRRAAREATDAPPQFVGAATCAGCHAAEADAWRASHHALAMQPATTATVLGAFDGRTLTHFGVTSTFFQKDGRFLVRTDGPDGTLAEYEVTHTFGVHPLQQYLVAFPGGRRQALPLAWDTRPATDGGQRWFHLHPDEPVPAGDLLHWTGFAGTWNQMCAECHSTNVRKGYDAETDTYRTTSSEVAVACEACHGPGSRHVAWASAGRPADGSGSGLVVDLADRDGARWTMNAASGIARRSVPRRTRVEVETCARCHARRDVVSEDYVFGRPLMDTHRPSLLDEPFYHADGQVAEEDYEYDSFLQSRMYAAGVTCHDCHDPHSLGLRDVTDDPDAVCVRCHLPATFATPAHHHHADHSPGASCVACHMPAHTYMVVDERRDHSIRIPRPDLSVQIGTPNACTGCHADRPAQWADDAVTRWVGRDRRPHWAPAIDAARRSRADAPDALERVAGDASRPAIVRATATALLRGRVRPESRPVIDVALHDDDPLVRASAATAVAELDPTLRVALVGPLLSDPVRGVRTEAAHVLASVRDEALPAERRPAFAAALGEYRAAQLLNGDRAEGRLNLALLDLDRGDPVAAEHECLAALRIAPAFPPVYVTLAEVYRLQRRDPDGERVLREGAAKLASSAELQHALGLVLVREKRPGEALAPLERAATLAPDDVRYAYVYAVALGAAGRLNEAVNTLERAHDRHPEDRDVLAALATMNRSRGDVAHALQWARALVDVAPDDAGARRMLAQMEAAAAAQQ